MHQEDEETLGPGVGQGTTVAKGTSDPDPTLSTGPAPREGPATAGATAPGRPPQQARRLPELIEDYRILGLLGTGGMGVVYEAEQQSPRRRVALKVMRQVHLLDEATTRMFAREVETLGRLKHPNIATIYESGRTGEGHDYFTMELVQGETLDIWLAKRPRAVTQQELRLRLRMFHTLCEAVHYAHLRGVIHRDLKPSNIIVTERTDTGRGPQASGLPALKILDFGLARLVSPEGAAASVQTQVGVVMGTLQYMSPEQAKGQADAIDVRTDVYALGVILYELLTGRRPYEVDKAVLSEAIRVICEQPPRRVSESWSGVRRLDGEVETIVGKALEKASERRYSSAGALGEDVDRYLSSQPILAMPPSRVYRARMFVRRHRAGVAIASSLVIVLAAFGAAMAIQARRIAREAEVSRRVSEFMIDMFAVSDPSESRGNSVTAREILDKAAKKIGTGLAGDPEIQARLMRTMGGVYEALGLYAQARPLLESALAIRERILGPSHPDVSVSLCELAELLRLQGKYAEAEPLYKRSLSIDEKALGRGHPHVAFALANLANLYTDQARYGEAETLYRRSLGLKEEARGRDHPEVAQVLGNLATLCAMQGRFAEAEPLYRRALEIEEKALGRDHPAVAESLNALASLFYRERRYAEAEPLYRRSLEIEEKTLGRDHPDVGTSLNNLAQLYKEEGKYAEAEPLLSRALEIMEKSLGPDHPNVAIALGNLANLLREQGRGAEAEPLCRRSLEIREKAFGRDHPSVAVALAGLASLYDDQGRYAEAEPLFERSVAISEGALSPDHPDLALAVYGLACVEARLGKRAKALASLRRALPAGRDAPWMSAIAEDKDLVSLRGDPEFERIVAEVATRAKAR